MFRRLITAFSTVVVFILKPIKIFAYRTRFTLLRRLIIEFTTFLDWLSFFINGQNESMLLHYNVYKGNFIYGKGVMETDYDTVANAITKPLFKNNFFMGIPVVATDTDAFATNAPVLQMCPPLRKEARKYIDKHIITKEVLALDYESVQAQCKEIMEEWKEDPKMFAHLRGTTTRIYLKLLGHQTLPKAETDLITSAYIRRFGELTLLSYYFPFFIGLLGTRKRIRQDAYLKLKEYGFDNLMVDMTLFAAMFSVGTIVGKCVKYVKVHEIDYPSLSHQEKKNFIYEAQRLYPTVTSTQRIVEGDEVITVSGKELKLTSGDQVDYPFICANLSAEHFENPKKLDLNRPQEEYDRVLSWSKGPHYCPAKLLSILTSVMLLDALAEKHSLAEL